MPSVVGVDRTYVKQGKDPETALRLSERPDLRWIRFVVDSYGTIATARRRQLSVSGDRLLVHAKADEVAEHLLPDVLAAVERANERHVAYLDEQAARGAVPLEGRDGAAIADAFDAIDAAIAISVPAPAASLVACPASGTRPPTTGSRSPSSAGARPSSTAWSSGATSACWTRAAAPAA